ncbi:hypothetical protein ACCAA_50139 [Candidatus Accumulibacter aalborgensis]|uniref:ABC transporter domain-containing protein n=1 Tax=Candidatus Accumulibacter aalborgensis TaxID=1860102 RepID=A0A1A8XS25_9PROT|nr:hypothetical protein ACCAA_50139 [Candidatus Accumulibacter aalborgensis]
MSPEIHARFGIDRREFTLEVELTLPGRGITGLFGHSGSGKSTRLRFMEGLEGASDGYVAMGDEVRQDEAKGLFVPPHRCALRVVFQQASIFPHLSVRGNMRFGEQRAPLRLAQGRRTARHRTLARPLARPVLRRRAPAHGDRHPAALSHPCARCQPGPGAAATHQYSQQR